MDHRTNDKFRTTTATVDKIGGMVDGRRCDVARRVGPFRVEVGRQTPRKMSPDMKLLG